MKKSPPKNDWSLGTSIKILEEDLPTIISDYQKIAQKIKEGRAHELSERDGMYLSTSRKGAGRGRDLTSQPFSDTPANKRAWSFKQSYITRLYQEAIFTSEELESIARATKDTSKPFTQIIEEKILQYRGKSEEELCKEFDIKFDAKGRNNSIVTKMMQLLDLPQEIENTIELFELSEIIASKKIFPLNHIHSLNLQVKIMRNGKILTYIPKFFQRKFCS